MKPIVSTYLTQHFDFFQNKIELIPTRTQIDLFFEFKFTEDLFFRFFLTLFMFVCMYARRKKEKLFPFNCYAYDECVYFCLLFCFLLLLSFVSCYWIRTLFIIWIFCFLCTTRTPDDARCDTPPTSIGKLKNKLNLVGSAVCLNIFSSDVREADSRPRPRH